MLFLLQIATLLILIIIIYQDFKFRAISWIYLLVLVISCSGISLVLINIRQLIINTALNVSFLLLQIILISVYFSLKRKIFTNIFKNYLGIGDLLFLFSISLLFVPVNYILFLISGFLFTLIFSGIYYLIEKPVKLVIPLAGVMSIFLIILVILNMLIKSDLFLDDGCLFNILHK